MAAELQQLVSHFKYSTEETPKHAGTKAWGRSLTFPTVAKAKAAGIGRALDHRPGQGAFAATGGACAAIVIDDSRAMRSLLKTILKNAGLSRSRKPKTARSADDGSMVSIGPTWRWWMEHAIMNGLEFIQFVPPKTSRCRDMRILMVTTEVEMQQRCAGARSRSKRIHHEAIHRRQRARKAATDGLCGGGGMSRIRVLIVDDAVVVRRIVSECFRRPRDRSCRHCRQWKDRPGKSPQVNPDLVTLDVEMPEMNGLETLREIRKIYPRLPVVMFSTLTSAEHQLRSTRWLPAPAIM